MGPASTILAFVLHGSRLLPTVPVEQSVPVLWYLTRASASAAYVALTLATICGMLRGIARTSGEYLSWVVDELHQVLSNIFGGLVVMHLVTLYYHTFIPFTVSNFLWPGQQPYRPLAVNLGVLGLYTLVILLISSWIRRRLSYRVWRWLHYLGFATFVLVTWHGLLAGSDAGESWMHALYAGASAAVGFVLLMRLLTRRTARQHQRTTLAPLAPRPTPARLTQLHQVLPAREAAPRLSAEGEAEPLLEEGDSWEPLPEEDDSWEPLPPPWETPSSAPLKPPRWLIESGWLNRDARDQSAPDAPESSGPGKPRAL
jgi:hypothetical protein